jgi:Flp pilus assembly protein TadD
MPHRKKRPVQKGPQTGAAATLASGRQLANDAAVGRIAATDAAIAIALAVLTLALYLRVSQNNFVYYDDPSYVSENFHVQAGLTPRSLYWDFTTLDVGFWQPVTWISFQLDCAVFGMSPAAIHLDNACLHVANSVLLFAFLLVATGQRWSSAACAALFAWHPLRVESVAWISERKDVLCAFFFLLALLAYLAYVRRGGLLGYALVVLLFTIGLMAKSMIVSLPVLLLLLDLWPLARFAHADIGGVRRLLLEKVPLLLIAGAACPITYIAEHGGVGHSGVQSLWTVPTGDRIPNAIICYVRYLGKIFWPSDLAIPYLYSSSWRALRVAGALIFLAFVTWGCAVQFRRRPYLLVGWLWFLIALLPVSGFVQVALQAMADRYTYLPGIGLALAVCWAGAEIVQQYACRRFMVFATGAVLLVLAALTFRQIGYWRDSVTLFAHAAAVTHDNWIAESALGSAFMRQGRFDDAEAHFREALRIRPGTDYLEKELDRVALLRNQLSAPEAQFAQAVRNDPGNKSLQYGWANLLLHVGQFPEAIEHYRLYLKVAPDDPSAHNDLGIALAQSGDLLDGRDEFERALALAPNYANAECGLGVVLLKLERFEEAIAHFQRALALRPDMESAKRGLEKCEAEQE